VNRSTEDLARCQPAGPGWQRPAFAGLTLAADLARLAFLRATDFSDRRMPGSVLCGLAAHYLAGYASILALNGLAWTVRNLHRPG
jgi:hypothetical protein